MGEYTPQSRSEEILYDTIHSLEYTERPQSRIEELLLELKAVIEAGGGTTDYDDLENKPSINNVELSGDKSLSDLGAASEEAVAAKASQSDIAPAFSDATAYTAGDVVYYDGNLYRFTADHADGAWDSADVEPVTVNDLVDGLKPVDSVTDGDMRPVTSNAVYDYLKDEVSVTNQGSETVKSMLTRLWRLIDFSKMTNNSTIIRGREVYHVITMGTSSGKDALFSRTSIGSISVITEKIFIDEANSEFSENTITSGNLTHVDKSSSTAYGGFTLYYR